MMNHGRIRDETLALGVSLLWLGLNIEFPSQDAENDQQDENEEVYAIEVVS